MTGLFTGSSSILFHAGRLVLEVRKAHKWGRTPDGATLIGIGGIGGTMEAGESPVSALQREAIEEIGCTIALRSARRTVVESPDAVRVVEDVSVDGYRPAMIWEVTDPTYQVGAQVAVYLGRTEAVPQPGDLPAILLAEPAWIAQLEDPTTLQDAVVDGVEVRSSADLPPDAVIEPVNTLRRLLLVREIFPHVFEEFLDDGV